MGKRRRIFKLTRRRRSDAFSGVLGEGRGSRRADGRLRAPGRRLNAPRELPELAVRGVGTLFDPVLCGPLIELEDGRELRISVGCWCEPERSRFATLHMYGFEGEITSVELHPFEVELQDALDFANLELAAAGRADAAFDAEAFERRLAALLAA